MAVEGQEQRLQTSSDVYKNYAGFAGNTLSLIFSPLVVYYAFNNTYFGKGALVGSVFDYHITTLATLPFLMIVGTD